MDGLLLDRLCRVYKSSSLPNGDTVRLRCLSDTEKRECELEALYASSKVVQRLRDKSSRDYQAIILKIKMDGVEVMREALVAYFRLHYTRQSFREVKEKFIPFPDNAQDDERRDVLIRRSDQREAIGKQRQEWVAAKVVDYAQSLDGKSEDELGALIDKYAADGNANIFYNEEYVRAAIFYATETSDGTRRFYASLDEVRALPAQIVNALYHDYQGVDGVDPFLLKSPSATDTSTA